MLSDAVKYMVAADTTLKSLYPKLLHMICAVNLLHHCATKVKTHFEDVDQLITKAKSATVKNKTRQANLPTIGCLPQPVITKWESWLNAALYYAEFTGKESDCEKL